MYMHLNVLKMSVYSYSCWLKIKHLPLLVLQLTATSTCVSISHLEEAKCGMDTVDRHVYYTFFCDTGLAIIYCDNNICWTPGLTPVGTIWGSWVST